MLLEETFFSLRQKKEDLNTQLKEVQEKLDQAETEMVLWLENNNLTQIKSENGTLFLRDEVYARVVDPDVAFKWLRDHQMGDVIKETCHSKTLSSLVKDNGEIPGVAAHYQTRVGFRSNNNKS